MMQEVSLEEFEGVARESSGNEGADELTKRKSSSKKDSEEDKVEVEPKPEEKVDAPEVEPKESTPDDPPSKANDHSVVASDEPEKSFLASSFFQIESLLGLDEKLSSIGEGSFDTASYVDTSVREPSAQEPSKEDTTPKSSLDPPGFNVKKIQVQKPKPTNEGESATFGQRLMSTGSGFLQSFGMNQGEEKKEEDDHLLVERQNKSETPNHVSFAPNTRDPCDDTVSFTATMTMDSAYDSQYKSTFLPVVAACLDDGFLLIEDGCKMVDRATSTCAAHSSGSVVENTANNGEATKRSETQDRGLMSSAWTTRNESMLAPCMTLSFSRARTEDAGNDAIVDDESKITLDEAISKDADVHQKYRMRSASTKYSEELTLDPSADEATYEDQSPSFEWFFSSFDPSPEETSRPKSYYMPTVPPKGLSMPTIEEEDEPSPRVFKPDPPSSKSRKIKSKASSKKEPKKEFSAENPPIDAELFGQMNEEDQQAAIDMARKLAERAEQLKNKRKNKRSRREVPAM